MPAYHPVVPPPPKPTKVYFDPYHSSAIGHQIHAAKLSGSTAWRESRSHKLKHQFKDDTGRGGERHLSDLVGAGSEKYGKDGRKDNGDWEVGASGLREEGWQDIRLLMDGVRKRSNPSVEDEHERPGKRLKISKIEDLNEDQSEGTSASTESGIANQNQTPLTKFNLPNKPVEPSCKSQQIFRNLNIYVNGSTAPLVSDHRLKQLFVQHGGNISLALGRRTVTHVILGDTCGGGLAFSKIQKEVSNVRGKGIKYVNVRWVLDSVEKGIRQREEKYVPKHIARKIGGSGQPGVAEIFASNNK